MFEYLYRDASNYKQHERVLLIGAIEPGDEHRIRRCLMDGEWFIPEQVGLEPLQERFTQYSPVPDQDDHVWHEFVRLRPAETGEARDLPCGGDKETLLAAFEAVGDWRDERSRIYAQLLAGLTIAR